MQLYHPVQRNYPIFTPLTDLLSNYTTYPKEISNFHTLDWFFKQLYHPTSPIQRKYPIFTLLIELLSNYTTLHWLSLIFTPLTKFLSNWLIFQSIYHLFNRDTHYLREHSRRPVWATQHLEHSHTVIRIQTMHPAHYGWPCTNNA